MSAKLGEILVRENLLSAQQLREALDYQRSHGGRLGYNLVKMGLVSDDMITAVLPLSRVGASLTLAMVDPTNVFAMDDIKFMTGLNIEPVVVSEASVQEAIARYYSGSREIELARDLEESANSNGNGHLDELPGSG